MISYGISRGFDRSRTHGWYVSVRRRKEYFRSEQERDDAYDQRIAEARTYGEAAGTPISPQARAMLTEMDRLAANTGYTPMEVFERGLTLVGRKPRATQPIADAVKRFLAESKEREREGLIRNRRLIELKSTLTRFAARLGHRDLWSISRNDVQNYLREQGVGPQTRINQTRVIGRLFTWASAESGMNLPNPAVVSERVKRTPITFTAKEVRKLFKLAPRELVPMLVLQWFAGLRPAATHGIRWEDINRERRTVVIRAEVSKLREPEIIEGLPDELWAWLDGVDGRLKGRVAHPNHVKLNKRLHHRLGYGGRSKKRWPEDVARHTFASHLFPRVASIEAVSKVLCHRGSRVTLKHYVAKNVTKEQAEKYFGLLATIAASPSSARTRSARSRRAPVPS